MTKNYLQVQKKTSKKKKKTIQKIIYYFSWLALAQVFLGPKKFEEKLFSRVNDVTNVNRLTTNSLSNKDLQFGVKSYKKWWWIGS